MFLLLTGLCLILALAFVLYPFIRASNEITSQERNALNVTLHKEYLVVVEQQLANGDIESAVFDQLKVEAEDKLLSDYNDEKAVYSGQVMPRWIGLALGFVVVAGSVVLYQQLGAITDWRLSNQYHLLAKQGEALDQQEYKVYIDKVAAHAESSAYAQDWWFVAAQGYLANDDYSKSINAFQRLHELRPNDSSVMANLGQAIYLSNNRTMSEQASGWLNKALAIDSTNTTALGVFGISAFEQADYLQAISYWNKALAVLPPFSRQAQVLTQGVTNAKQALGQQSSRSTKAETDGDSTNREIQISLSLGENVGYSTEQSIFVFATAVNGPRFPLAAVKVTAGQLPINITLDESNAMQTGVSIAQYDNIIVSARLSINSDPIAAKGDWQSEAVALDLSKALEPVELVINQPIL